MTPQTSGPTVTPSSRCLAYVARDMCQSLGYRLGFWRQRGGYGAFTSLRDGLSLTCGELSST